MEEKVSSQTIKRRSALLRSISERKRIEFGERFTGRELTVLFESSDEGHWSGFTENYVRVTVPSEEKLGNQIRNVRLQKTAADFVMGELL
jgi:threonylcarbamoyladenosine tRNA methylthiotransferase MtaB